jgi:magnesium transporter
MRLPSIDTRPPAMPPDALVHVGERRVQQIGIRVLDYTSEHFKETETASVAECVAFEGRDSPTWIMVTGLHEPKIIREMLEAYGIHPLIQQDILNTAHPPKLDDLRDYLFLATTLIELRSGTQEREIDSQHFSLILTERLLITFQEAPTEIFSPVLKRLRDGMGRLRTQGPDYLMWALLDSIMDHYLLVLGELEDTVSGLEEKITEDTRAAVDMTTIHELRRLSNQVHRSLRPMREVAIGLQRSENPLLTPHLQPFLRDLYDHTWQGIQSAESLRESITAIREFYQSMLAQRLNEVMKVLAAISTLFLPLTFLAGVYGMNFDYQPELHWKWGYAGIWGVFLLLIAGMLWYFRRRKWL